MLGQEQQSAMLHDDIVFRGQRAQTQKAAVVLLVLQRLQRLQGLQNLPKQFQLQERPQKLSLGPVVYQLEPPRQ